MMIAFVHHLVCCERCGHVQVLDGLLEVQKANMENRALNLLEKVGIPGSFN